MRAGWTEPCDINCLAKRQLFADKFNSFVGVAGTKLTKSRGRQQPRGATSRGVKASGAEAGVLGAGSFVSGHIQRLASSVARGDCKASIILGGGQQRLFRSAEYSAACVTALGLRQLRQSKTILGRERCRSVRRVLLA